MRAYLVGVASGIAGFYVALLFLSSSREDDTAADRAVSRCDCVLIKRPHILADHWVPDDAAREVVSTPTRSAPIWTFLDEPARYGIVVQPDGTVEWT